jgi:hypothetical protein
MYGDNCVGEDVNTVQRGCQGQSGDDNLPHNQISKTKNLVMMMMKLAEMVAALVVVIMIVAALAEMVLVMLIVMLVMVMVLIMKDAGVLVPFLNTTYITLLQYIAQFKQKDR